MSWKRANDIPIELVLMPLCRPAFNYSQFSSSVSAAPAPEAVLIRREGWRLSLHGRSPMEHVDVPRCIPKEERHLFRDAIIAGHGGKTLAGLFYLRAFIEQFARRIIGETGRRPGNEIVDDYGKTLSEQYRGLMPSLREWYGKL